LRLLHQPGDLSELGIGADSGGTDHQPPAGVHAAAGHRIARSHLGGRGITGGPSPGSRPGEHGGVTRLLDHRDQVTGAERAGEADPGLLVAKLTVALTPSILFSFFSIRAAHEAQVIPPMDNSTLPPGSAAASGARAVPVLNSPSLPPGRGGAG
jgi:hypothetical protein